MPRSVPSTSRRYRSFSPSVISQYAITILQYVIEVQNSIWHGINEIQVRARTEAYRTLDVIPMARFPRLIPYRWDFASLGTSRMNSGGGEDGRTGRVPGYTR